MAGTVEDTTKALITRMKDALGDDPDAKTVLPLLDAIENNRLHFEREPWYDIIAALAAREKAVPSELLLRARDENGAAIAQEIPVNIINRHGLYAPFDAAITLSAVKQTIAQHDFPVSINISSRNACDADALTGLHTLLQAHFAGQYRPSDIIFEFLEDDQAEGVSDTAIRQMKMLGYKFAIDDLSHADRDAARLKNLGPYVDFVKIDGHSLEKAKAGEISLGDFIARIEREAPQADILCEWVDSAEEAESLNEHHPGIRMVQGRNLGHDAKEFSRKLRAADDRNPKWGPLKL
ncbi:MAG: EAL domain-containing protein [Micavibrio sp.]